MRLSKRASGAAESATLRLWAGMARLRAAGVKVISLLEGEADLPAPQPVKAAIARALRENQTRYSNSQGLPELREAIARKLRCDNHIRSSGDQILVTNGAKQAIYTALQVLCNPGDEVVLPTPYWVTFPESIKLAGAKPVFVPAPGHDLDVDALGRAITKRTKALLLCTPNNPTGAVYSRHVLEDVAALARKKDLAIIMDEAYEALVFDGRDHVSLASLSPDAARRTITIQTFSKIYSMTGLRVGYFNADPGFVKAAVRMHGHVTGNVATPLQYGALATLRLGASFIKDRRAEIERRRNAAYKGTARFMDCLKPRGGFFVFADARRFMPRFKTSAALAEHLLRKARVAVVPGSACGQEGFLRVSFSNSVSLIEEGLRRIEDSLASKV